MQPHSSPTRQVLVKRNRRTTSSSALTTPANQVKLEHVLGTSITSGACLSCDSQSGTVAYPAGCVVVLYNTLKNAQNHLINVSKKTITCLSFCPDGRYLATGESGHQPAVRVWDTQDGTQISEMQGHTYGVACVTFATGGSKYLVSVGSQHDMLINVWQWRSGQKVATNKVSSRVHAVSFATNGAFFVTVGVRHVKFWYLEKQKGPPGANGAPGSKENAVPLMGRSAILADQRNNHFVDVVCGAQNTYCITQSGLLCEFNGRRLLHRWVELKTKGASAICLSDQLVFVACTEGVVRVFSTQDLGYVATLPKPHHLGVDLSKALTPKDLISHAPGARFPDVTAVCYDDVHKTLTTTYSDHSVYHWDVADFNRVGKKASFLYHTGQVWGVDTYPESSNAGDCLPPGSFVTCGADDTVRVWNLDFNVLTQQHDGYKPNLYSSELRRVYYTDKDFAHLCDPTANSLEGATNQEARNGVRVVRISPDGAHLAAGDRSGNIRIFTLKDYMHPIVEVEAHDSEVLCLEYSNTKQPNLLASASRDRLIHLFDVANKYEFLCTIDDHSSFVTSLRFAQLFSRLQLITCGADKSILFREIAAGGKGTQLVHSAVCKATPVDLEVDLQRNMLYAACQDRQIRLYNLQTAKQRRTVKGLGNQQGTMLKMQMDVSLALAATTCADKTVSVFDTASWDCVGALCGHSETVTCVRFSQDLRRMFTVSCDGCIFVWRLSGELLEKREKRVAREAAPDLLQVDAAQEYESDDTDITNDTAEEMPSAPAVQVATPDRPPQPGLTHGRWSQRKDIKFELAMDPSQISPSAAMHLEGDDEEVFMAGGNIDAIRRRFEEDALRKAVPQGKVTQRGGGADPVMYFPGGPRTTESEFLVQERAADGSGAGGKYRRSDSMGFGGLGDSEDEDGGGFRVEDNSASSAPNLVAAYVAEQQRSSSIDSRYYLPQQGSPEHDSLVNSGGLDRNSPSRQSITSRFLQRSAAVANAKQPQQPQSPAASLSSPSPRADSATSSLSVPSTERSSEDASGTGAGSRGVWGSRGRPAGFLGGAATRASSQGPSRWGQQARGLAGPSPTSPTAATWSYQKPTVQSPGSGLLRRDLLGGLVTTSQASTGGNYRRPRPVSEAARDKVRRRTLPSASSYMSFIEGEDKAQAEPFSAQRSGLFSRHGTNADLSEGGYNSEQTPQGGAGRKMFSYFASTPRKSELDQQPPQRGMSNLSRLSSMSMSSINQQQYAEDGPMNRRISDLREKLRKSTDNLAALIPNGGNEADTRSRSKSIGNVQMAIAPIVHSRQSPEKEPSPQSNLTSSRSMAKSLTNLTGAPQTGGRSLTETLDQLKKLSRTDLRGVGLQIEEQLMEEDRSPIEERPAKILPQLAAVRGSTDSNPGSGSFYDRASTLPRSRRSSSALHKKVDAVRSTRHHEQGHSGVSGDSDSSETPSSITGGAVPPNRTAAWVAKVGQGGTLAPPPTIAPKPMEGGARFGARRVTEGVLAPSPQKKPNYLAQLLARDEGASAVELPSVRKYSAEGRKGSETHYDKMVLHITDAKSSFRPALDKIIQAYQLVLDDQELSTQERNKLLAKLRNELEVASQRIGQTLGAPPFESRPEPDGGHSVAPAAVSPPLVPVNGSSATIAGKGSTGAGTGSQDPAVLLEQYSNMLVTMIQQKMTTKGGQK